VIDAGPLQLVDESELAPFPPAPSFEGIVANHLGAIAGADGALAGAGVHATADPPDDIPGYYAATVGAAADNAGNESSNTGAGPLLELVGAGDGADSIRVDSAKYLPGADAPIGDGFIDPPAAPGDIGEPGGVENPPPPQV